MRVFAIAAVVSLLLCGKSFGLPEVKGIASQADDGTTNDFFDVAQGTIVTSHSDLLPGFTAEGAFGSTSPDASEGYRTIFGTSPTGTHFIEFKTAAPIMLSGYRFLMGEDSDGSGNRSATAFRLYASNNPATVLSHLVSSTALAPPFTANYGFPKIEVSDAFDERKAQFFRMEVDSIGNGPRIFELDGYGGTVPEPTSFLLLLIGFTASLGFRRLRTR